MSAPFAGPPALPFGTTDAPQTGEVNAGRSIHDDLAALDPPRKHYHWYYSTRPADGDMRHCPQGIHAFLRAYYHHKSADWRANRPFRLASWTAGDTDSTVFRSPSFAVVCAGRGPGTTLWAGGHLYCPWTTG